MRKPFQTQLKTQLNNEVLATGGSARGADGARRRCPPQAQKDGRNVPKNPVTKTVVAVGLGRGAYAGSANESKPDGQSFVPFAKRQGDAAGEATLAGDARSRFERTVFYPAHVFRISLGAERLQRQREG